MVHVDCWDVFTERNVLSIAILIIKMKKIIMKEYEKRYEDVFTSQRILRNCKLENISLDNSMNVDKYRLLFNKTLKDYQKFLFDYWVKIAWLIKNFTYCGHVKGLRRSSDMASSKAFGIFMRHYIGFDNKFITRNSFFGSVCSYLYDFFPDFDINNPFEIKFEYPYKYMNLECLCLVYQMTERLDLLKVGEREKMGYSKFQDYVINYINCYNEEHGNVYLFRLFKGSGRFIPYVTFMKKGEKYE